jgi:hypothetical protein
VCNQGPNTSPSESGIVLKGNPDKSNTARNLDSKGNNGDDGFMVLSNTDAVDNCFFLIVNN